jgi:uncharacterized membrane protein YuzA (DUF378 family)
MISDYVQHKLYAVAVLLLVVGGLNWGYVAFTGKDFVTYALGKGALANAIFLFVGIAAIAIAFFRDTYLPFLGPTVMPCGVLQTVTPEGADYEVRVFVKPGAKVLYWAAEPENKDLQVIQDWRQAYLTYRNAGVTVADENGNATLRVRTPQAYTVPMKGALSQHVHYRVCLGEGFMGRVETVTLDGKEYFENEEEPEEKEEPFMNEEEMEEEPFANAPVMGIHSPSFPSDNAIPELNTVAQQTAEQNIMSQEGGILEAPHPHGADLEAAFLPPVPVKYTEVNYS